MQTSRLTIQVSTDSKNIPEALGDLQIACGLQRLRWTFCASKQNKYLFQKQCIQTKLEHNTGLKATHRENIGSEREKVYATQGDPNKSFYVILHLYSPPLPFA